MMTATKRTIRKPSPLLKGQFFDTRVDDAIVLADMRERTRLFGTTSFRFA